MATVFEALTVAIQHHRQGRLQAAEQIYRQILAVVPNQADAWHLLGLIAYQTDKHGNAVEYIERAIGLNATDAAFHNNLGEAYRALHRVPEAVACYQRALQHKPDYAEAHNNLGNALKEQKKLDEAAAHYVRALELKPDYAEAHYNLGNARKEQGKPVEAVSSYRRALELKPDFAETHNNLGNALGEQGKLDEAINCYRRALELKPDFAETHNNLGKALADQGKLDEAIVCYRRALELRPAYTKAFYNLGNALQEQGKLDDAIGSYRRALELNSDPAAANSLGNALKEQGKLEEAAACYCRALHLKPSFFEALYNLANVLREQGKPDEALACHQHALRLQPHHAETHNNLGNALNDQGKLNEAIACYRRALELKPDFAKAHYNLGNALKERGELDEAAACHRRALELEPDYAEAHNNLGNILREQGKLVEAAASVSQALELKPHHAEMHNNLGNVLREQEKLAQAVACFRHVLELKPDYAEAQNNLGRVLQEIGDLQGAEDAFRGTLRHNSNFALAHYNLATLLGGRLPENDLDTQRRLLQGKQLTDAERLLLHFGVAQVLDSRGRYAEAAEHLDRGNALQLSEQRKRGQEYDPNEYGSFVSRMIAVCTPDFFERVRGFGLDSEIPVFVVGLPRTGTTLVEQILASHSQVFGAGEIKLTNNTVAALGKQDAEASEVIEGIRKLDRSTALRLASRHLERLRDLNRDALRIVDKLPDNYLFLGLLATLFPRAKLIHCRRDLRDTAVSCWMTHFQEVRWANDQQHIAARFHDYERIVDHWRMVLPVPMFEVDYEETVADLEGVARKLVAWCGLEWEPSCLEFHRAKRPVRTASAVQVRQPVFRTSVARWKHYEQFLAPLFAQLEPSRECLRQDREV